MSKHAAKVGNIGTDHDGFHPTAITAGSPDVFIDGIPAARVGDPLAPHDKPNHPPHPRKIASGSSTVLVNGKPLAITGGAVDCGGVIIGSGTVIVGDIAPPVATPLSISGLFDEHFSILDSETGIPFKHLAYGMTSSAGKIEGLVDADGKTSKVKGMAEEDLTLDYVFQTKIGLR
ncbi:type VI secretion system PAAR protein [Aeromonas enteropelogenes]|uniref:type VI secretion system PAAR protein n=1 Tax=Aeromonas enteropelogenes TaxID=29489 RepID=UPI0031371828